MIKKLDNVDFKILSVLSEDAQMAYTEVAKLVNVSGGTVHLRMKKMMDMGVVKGTTLNMDYSKIGWDLTAFISVYLHDTSQYDSVKETLGKIPEVVKVHYTLGRFNMFLKVHAADAKHLKEILHDKIETIPQIQRTESFLSLEEGINRHIAFPED